MHMYSRFRADVYYVYLLLNSTCMATYAYVQMNTYLRTYVHCTLSNIYIHDYYYVHLYYCILVIRTYVDLDNAIIIYVHCTYVIINKFHSYYFDIRKTKCWYCMYVCIFCG